MVRRLVCAGVLLGSLVAAAPPLTTVQDVLYKADGTRFNGTVTISWTSFEASDSSAIATQSTTTKVVDGSLRVQLVPTSSLTPEVFYSVKYNSDGRVQFEETWTVPPSTQPVRVRDVRVASGAGAVSSGGGNGNLVPESNVINLVADLAARPVKGTAYTAGRVAMVNTAGGLDSVAGSPGDCVRVDGTSGPCGMAQPAFIDGETPAGIVDGANTTFTLAGVPDPLSSISIYRNGIHLKAGEDYTASGNSIQFVAAATPRTGDLLLASYRTSGVPSGATAFPFAQVLCGGAGSATNSVSLTSVGACQIPDGVLAPGDRIEIRCDFEHQGAASAFSVEVHWGGTTVLQRDAAVNDALFTGRVEAAIRQTGAQLSAQSWGTVLPLSAAVATSTDGYPGGVTIDFLGKVTQGADVLALRNFTVVRLP